MTHFFNNPKTINAIALVISFIVIRFIIAFGIKKVGRKNGIIQQRIRLIIKYITTGLYVLATLIVAYIYGVEFESLAVIFSSVFAILGIALFAVWSILSNVTAGIIMFFSLPYKVGDKVEIHDKEIPLPAVIEDMKAFHLHLRLENGDLVTYPNNMMLQKPVTLIEKR